MAPAEKVQQLGTANTSALIASFLTSSQAKVDGLGRNEFIMDGLPQEVKCIVDLTPHTLDVARAFLMDWANGNTYYVAMSPSDEHHEWAQDFLAAFVTDKLLAGEMKLANASLPEKEISTQLLAAEPPRPQLSMLVFNED
eukprot:6460934-Amphidinium_carterae.1